MAVFALSTGTLIALFVPQIVSFILDKSMTLTEGSPAFDAWQEADYPTFMKVYLFSVANSRDVERKGAKPHIKEMGPYVFREYESKHNIIDHACNSTKSYQIKKTWHFIPKESADIQENITTLNVPMLFAKNSNAGEYLDMMLEWMGTKTFINRTAAELIFEGYDDELLAMAEWAGEDVESMKFGWFHGKNATTNTDGIFNMFTGADDATKIGQINTWNHQNRTDYQGSCGEIRGSAGGFYPPSLKSDTLDLFSHQLCRVLSYHSKNKTEKHHLLDGIVYELPETTFANATVHPDNWCFENNLPSGLQNGSHCHSKSSPIYFSFPHFYAADQFYLDQFDETSDLKPSINHHTTKMLIEPVTNVPLQIDIRLQLNLQVPSFKSNEHPHIYFPAIWFEVHGEMTKEGSDGLIFVLKLPQMFYISTLTSMAFTIIILTICACRSFRQSIQKQFRSVPSDEESCNSNSTEDISVKDMSEKEPSEKDLFVSSNIIKHPKA